LGIEQYLLISCRGDLLPLIISIVTLVAASSAGRIGYLLANSATVQAVGGALITVLLGWVGTLFANRKRVAWRAYLDGPINLAPAPVRTRLTFRVYAGEQDHDTEANSEVEAPWLVILRVRNSGFGPIRGSDFNTPLTFTFPGQEVRGAEVIEHSDGSTARILPVRQPQARLDSRPRTTPGPGLTQRLHAWVAGPSQGPARRAAGDSRAPTSAVQFAEDILLNRRDRFTLMVVLSGTPREERKIRQTGSLVGGRIIAEPPRRGPTTRSLMFGGLAALPLAGLLGGLLISLGAPAGSQCTSGSLELAGSTAFAPAAASIASQYTNSCRSAHLGVSGTGSVTGLNALASAGADNLKQAGSQIAMSDGPAPPGKAYEPLSGTPVGVIIFTLVANRDTRVASLTSGQIRAIFAGRITNWQQLGGLDLPISIVSRYPDSGSRRTFDQYVLGGATEPQPSSYDCADKNEIPGSPVILCQEPTTQDLLLNVADVPGAIGYAQSSDVENYTRQGIQSVELNGLQGIIGNIGADRGKYPFWTVEYLYTYGTPAPGSLAERFLNYMGTYTARDLLRLDGYTPCVDSTHNLMATLCAPRARRRP
jgi:phosphate transport system substrate-binding protein